MMAGAEMMADAEKPSKKTFTRPLSECPRACV